MPCATACPAATWTAPHHAALGGNQAERREARGIGHVAALDLGLLSSRGGRGRAGGGEVGLGLFLVAGRDQPVAVELTDPLRLGFRLPESRPGHLDGLANPGLIGRQGEEPHQRLSLAHAPAGARHAAAVRREHGAGARRDHGERAAGRGHDQAADPSSRPGPGRPRRGGLHPEPA
ncbi:MAG: hypothetical protein R2909_03615 [Gemmatimonadales bacterium]